jgi:hypothetical protein
MNSGRPEMNMENGKKNWYIVDGYLPYPGEVKEKRFEGHEAVMLLNCNEEDAEVLIDIYYEEKKPVKDIRIRVKAETVKCIRMDHPDEIGGVMLGRQEQYSLRIRSNVSIVAQYGRMDVAQPNLAYIGMIGYSE